MHTPIVTIIMPAYNAEQYIRECIDSILNQDFVDWQLVIVDDGSTDSTLAICREYAAECDKVTVISQSNQGVSAARNNGIAVATGEYIMFIDADDILPAHALKTFKDALDAHPSADLLRGEYAAIDLDGNKLFSSNKKVFDKSKLYQTNNLNKFLSKYVLSDYFLWLLWIRRACITGIKFDENQIYMEDTRFIFDIMANIKTCVYIPQIIYLYRKHPGAASSSLSDKKIDNILSLSHHLVEMKAKYSQLTSATIDKVIINCWNIIFDYIISQKTAERRCMVKMLREQENVAGYALEASNSDKTIRDFLYQDIDTFLKSLKRRRMLKRIGNLIFKCLSHLKSTDD